MIDLNWATQHDAERGHLIYIERLVLHALRQWVRDQSRWPEIVLEFNRICGPRAATRLCESLDSAFRTLGLHARRRIRLLPVGCARVSADEVCVLNIIAAHQARAARHADAMIGWLVVKGAAISLKSDIDVIARILFEAGYVLDIRTSAARPATATSPEFHAIRN